MSTVNATNDSVTNKRVSVTAEVAEAIAADYKSGSFTQAEIAKKHGISLPTRQGGGCQAREAQVHPQGHQVHRAQCTGRSEVAGWSLYSRPRYGIRRHPPEYFAHSQEGWS